MRPESGVADHAWVPVHAGAKQHGLAVWKQFEHLDERNARRLGNELGSLLEEGIQMVSS